MASRIWLYYVAASAAFIAGVLHLTLVPNVIDRNLGSGMLFLIGGIAQIFWVIPTVRRWGKSVVLHWYGRYPRVNNYLGYYKNSGQSHNRKGRFYKQYRIRDRIISSNLHNRKPYYRP